MNNLELAAHWLRGRDTLPRYLILGMTNLCNSKCVTCFYWDHLNVNRHLEMKLEEYDRALADLGSLYSVVLTGGEPTLNRELPEITKLLYRRHDASNVTMPTNSIIPEQVEAIVARVLESRKDERQTFTVGLSLDHLGERHDFIRGAPGNFVKLEETYRRLAALEGEVPRVHAERPDGARLVQQGRPRRDHGVGRRGACPRSTSTPSSCCGRRFRIPRSAR